MKKNLIKMLATFSLCVVLFTSNSTISFAYTQDDVAAAVTQWCKEHGVDMDNYRGGGRASRTHIL